VTCDGLEGKSASYFFAVINFAICPKTLGAAFAAARFSFERPET
jgi:hypothetical protein